MYFGPYGAFLSSDVLEMVDQQNTWNSLVMGTYLLYLECNVGMLVVNICILTANNHRNMSVWSKKGS
jgi:hypothetical protein